MNRSIDIGIIEKFVNKMVRKEQQVRELLVRGFIPINRILVIFGKIGMKFLWVFGKIVGDFKIEKDKVVEDFKREFVCSRNGV